MNARHRPAFAPTALTLVLTWILALGFTTAAHGAQAGLLETIASGRDWLNHASIATAANGDVYVAYADRPADASTYTVKLVRRPVAGSRSAADPGFVTTVLGTSTSSDSDDPKVAALPGGGVLALWYDSGGLKIEAFTAAGKPTSPQVVASLPPLDAELVVDGAGRGYVAWMEDGTPSQISQHLRIRSASGTLGAPMTLGTDSLPLDGIAIAASASGEGIAAWLTVLGPQSIELRARTFNASGPTNSVVDVVHGTDVSEVLAPAVATDVTGTRSVVTWNQLVTPTAGADPRAAVFASLIGSGGGFIAPQRVSSTTFGATGAPKAASAGNGEIIVGYDQVTDTASGTSSVLFNRFTPSSNTVGGLNTVYLPSNSRLLQLLGAPGSSTVKAITQSWTTGQTLPAVAQLNEYSAWSTAISPLGTDQANTIEGASTDQAGNTFAVILRSDGAIVLGSSDAVAPTIDSVTVPTDGVAGTPVSVSATASDVVGPTTTSWTFGDGSAEQEGTSVQHVYAKAGLYALTTYAIDGSGQRTSVIHYVTIAPAPAPDPPAGTSSGTETGSPGGGGGVTPAVGGAGNSSSGTGADKGGGPSLRVPSAVPGFKVAMLVRRRQVIGVLGVGVPRGGRMTVLCRSDCGRSGARLGSAEATRKVKRPRIVTRLRPGAVLEVRVTLKGRLGRYARFRVLARSPYAARITDGCLDARDRPTGC
jgi:PKD repeat protein